jgi:hypothetical protein
MKRKLLDATTALTLGAIFKVALASGFVRKSDGRVVVMAGSAAAWLVWSEKRRFHRIGTVDFKIPKARKTPPWFDAAVAVLKQPKNAQRWRVEHLTTPFERIYRVTWLQWATMRAARRTVP